MEQPAEQPASKPIEQPASKPNLDAYRFANVKGVCMKCGKPLMGVVTANELGACCKRYDGAPTYVKQAPTDKKGLVTVVELCNVSQRLGRSRGFANNMTGGDAGHKPAKETVFTAYADNGTRFVRREAIVALVKLVTGKAVKFETVDLTRPNEAEIAKAKAGK
jgi:hypothetical protein